MSNKIVIGIPYTGCSYKSEVPVTSEPEAYAFAAGYILGGGEALVFMQDCGFLASLNVIATLLVPYGIPSNARNPELISKVELVNKPEHHAYSCYIAEKIINDEKERADCSYSEKTS